MYCLAVHKHADPSGNQLNVPRCHIITCRRVCSGTAAIGHKRKAGRPAACAHAPISGVLYILGKEGVSGVSGVYSR